MVDDGEWGEVGTGTWACTGIASTGAAGDLLHAAGLCPWALRPAALPGHDPALCRGGDCVPHIHHHPTHTQSPHLTLLWSREGLSL